MLGGYRGFQVSSLAAFLSLLAWRFSFRLRDAVFLLPFPPLSFLAIRASPPTACDDDHTPILSQSHDPTVRQFGSASSRSAWVDSELHPDLVAADPATVSGILACVVCGCVGPGPPLTGSADVNQTSCNYRPSPQPVSHIAPWLRTRLVRPSVSPRSCNNGVPREPIAASLKKDQDLGVLDEPTNGLDSAEIVGIRLPQPLPGDRKASSSP